MDLDKTYEQLSQRERFYIDILITAVEGGVNYWATVNGYRWSDGNGKQIANTRAVLIEDTEGEPKHVLNLATIAKGMSLLHKGGGFSKNKKVETPEWWVKKWRTAYRDCATGDWDFDACDADVVVQAGLFGEVVYG